MNEHDGPGVPVYDEAGALFAHSVSAAARLLGCVPHNLHYHHLTDYRDGYQLKSRPNPARVGRRGGSAKRGSG